MRASSLALSQYSLCYANCYSANCYSVLVLYPLYQPCHFISLAILSALMARKITRKIKRHLVSTPNLIEKHRNSAC
jgi:hypothetical protein